MDESLEDTSLYIERRRRIPITLSIYFFSSPLSLSPFFFLFNYQHHETPCTYRLKQRKGTARAHYARHQARPGELRHGITGVRENGAAYKRPRVFHSNANRLACTSNNEVARLC